MPICRRPNVALQPPRLTIAPAAVGCKRMVHLHAMYAPRLESAACSG
jgi:hypothetical protein